MEKEQFTKNLKDYLVITGGVLIMVFALNFFLEPAKLAVGGVFGFAMIVNNIIPSIGIGDAMFVMNIVLFIIAFIIIGKEFGAKTIYSSLLLSYLVKVAGNIFHLTEPLTDDIFLNLFFGILVQGIGMAVIFYYGASTGGTDIIAKIINKFTNINIGKALFAADFLIVLGACYTFGITKGLYALLGVIMNAVVIDNMIEGLDLKINISVVSKKLDEIQKFVIVDLERGATVYEAKGAYTGAPKFVMHVVMSRKEFITLRRQIKLIDPDAFVIAHNVREVMGEGFMGR